MSKIGRFFRAVQGLPATEPSRAGTEKDVALRALDAASKDADRILDNAMSRALRETDRAIRRLRHNEAAGP